MTKHFDALSMTTQRALAILRGSLVAAIMTIIVLPTVGVLFIEPEKVKRPARWFEYLISWTSIFGQFQVFVFWLVWFLMGVFVTLWLLPYVKRWDNRLKEAGAADINSPTELASVAGIGVAFVAPKDESLWRHDGSSLDYRSPFVEALSSLAAALVRGRDAKPMRVAITSCSRGEGKTSTACTLATLLSEMGFGVRLIDANMRSPLVAIRFGLPSDYGLSHVLRNGVNVPGVYQVGQLQVVPAGPIPPNPSVLLGHRDVSGKWSHLCSGTDFCIIDTPPAASFADASQVVQHVDAVVVVVAAGCVLPSELSAVMTRLALNNHLTFALLNKVERRAAYAYDYGYEYRSSS